MRFHFWSLLLHFQFVVAGLVVVVVVVVVLATGRRPPPVASLLPAAAVGAPLGPLWPPRRASVGLSWPLWLGSLAGLAGLLAVLEPPD